MPTMHIDPVLLEEAEELTRRDEENKIEGHELIPYGFVRVDGLHTYDPMQSDPEKMWHTIGATIDSLGTMGSNNGHMVVVTERGKVWLGLYPDLYKGVSTTTGYREQQRFERLLRKLCPNSDGGDAGARAAFVAIVNCAELVRPAEILERMRDPNWVAEVW